MVIHAQDTPVWNSYRCSRHSGNSKRLHLPPYLALGLRYAILPSIYPGITLVLTHSFLQHAVKPAMAIPTKRPPAPHLPLFNRDGSIGITSSPDPEPLKEYQSRATWSKSRSTAKRIPTTTREPASSTLASPPPSPNHAPPLRSACSVSTSMPDVPGSWSSPMKSRATPKPKPKPKSTRKLARW